jgi:hypothetical protein
MGTSGDLLMVVSDDMRDSSTSHMDHLGALDQANQPIVTPDTQIIAAPVRDIRASRGMAIVVQLQLTVAPLALVQLAVWVTACPGA